jgi:hypothetical protein
MNNCNVSYPVAWRTLFGEMDFKKIRQIRATLEQIRPSQTQITKRKILLLSAMQCQSAPVYVRDFKRFSIKMQFMRLNTLNFSSIR